MMRRHVLLHSLTVITTALLSGSTEAQVPGPNVNMVSGTSWPGGDPFLQRQNEPSVAVSSRNALHLMAGANDYRTVDLPGLPGYETGEAWLGVFTSLDGGQTWRSTLLPGYPQDASPAGLTSPLKGFDAAADPTMRSGADGLFYFSGIVFRRSSGGLSRVFVARFVDRNDETPGSDANSLGPIRYLGTSIVDLGTPGQFVDKPYLAVDVPRPEDAMAEIDGVSRKVGKVYVAYTIIQGNAPNEHTKILIARSTDGGVTFRHPVKLSETLGISQGATVAVAPAGTVHVVWRVVRKVNARGKVLQPDAIYAVKSTDGGATFTKPVLVSEITPFEQGTTPVSFRTTMYPTVAVDGGGRVYVAWARFGDLGTSRVVVSTSSDGVRWSAPHLASPSSEPGHQLMPALTFAGGRLMLLYYDLREDHTVGRYEPAAQPGHYTEFRDSVPEAGPDHVFNRYVADAAPPAYGPTVDLRRRHTMDVRVARAEPSATPDFAPSVRVSQYHFGSQPGSTLIEQLYYNPPNLPMFRTGTVPFMGDFIDIASQSIVPTGDGGWVFNIGSPSPPVFHGVWTDNRHVIQPRDGDWSHYTPPRSAANTGTSRYDPSQPVPECEEGQAGSRNQDVFTARISDGLVTGAPASAKQLGPSQRAFAVFVQNATGEQKTFHLTIAPPPPGVQASFLQFLGDPPWTPVSGLDVDIPPYSTIARTVFVVQETATSLARIQVNVDEVPSGLSSVIILNADPGNPVVPNGTPEIFNPQIANPQIANPQIANPQIANPQIANPQIANPQIANPQIANPQIANPQIANPQIANPQIANPQIANGSMTDATWTIRNEGTTAAAYYVKLLHSGELPEGFQFQLIIHRLYETPQAVGCELATFRNTILAANIVDPVFTDPDDLVDPEFDTQNPEATNATVLIGPGEEVLVTLRVVGPSQAAVLQFLSQEVTPAAVAQAINTDDVGGPSPEPPHSTASLAIATASLPTAVAGAGYHHTLLAVGGTTPYTWGSSGLPPGTLTINPTTGVLEGTAPATGTYVVDAAVTDHSAATATRSLSLSVEPLGASTPALSFGVQPPGAALVGLPIWPAVRVRALDGSSAPVQGLGVTLSLQANPGGATLTGVTSVVTDASGYATFASLSLDAEDSGYTFLATANRAVSTTSSAFDVVREIRLTTGSAVDLDPKWSPDSTRIVFSRGMSDIPDFFHQQIFIMNADGTGEAQLTFPTMSPPESNADPAWLADGRILFTSTRDHNTNIYDTEIYVMNADGTNQVRLTNHAGPDFNPASSPDGTKIVFARGTPAHIWVMNADGSGPVELTGGAAGENQWPVWSPDGTSIAFTSDRAGSGYWQLYVMDADGTDVTQITVDAADSVTPSWSPDGEWLVYWRDDCDTSGGSASPCELWVVKPDGSENTNLTDSADGLDLDPDWSPDGTRIAFMSVRGGNTDIYVLSLGGTALLRARVSRLEGPVPYREARRRLASRTRGSSSVFLTARNASYDRVAAGLPSPSWARAR
jgi:Tol biopolymer transport system component